MEGISFVEKRLEIPPESFGREKNGTGEVIIETGSPTYLVDDVFRLIEKEVRNLLEGSFRRVIVEGLPWLLRYSATVAEDLKGFLWSHLILQKEQIWFWTWGTCLSKHRMRNFAWPWVQAVILISRSNLLLLVYTLSRVTMWDMTLLISMFTSKEFTVLLLLYNFCLPLVAYQ